VKRKNTIIFLAICIFFLGFNLTGAASGEKNRPKAISKDVPEPKLSVTHHSIKIDGQVLKYKATTGYMLMKTENGKGKAKIFFIAYTRDEERDLKKRPITFTFNGGPGSASLWLHMGGLGPKRVDIPDDGLHMPPPYGYVDNPYSWLAFTDLVFIDPVSTGYSRPVEGEDKKQFHGVREDIKSVGDFIRLYVTKYNRWLSPKFVCGESYGTTRAAGLSGYLQDTYGMYLKGVVLVSTVLNFSHSILRPGFGDLPYGIFLPTLTATAWYHNKLPAKYQENLEKTLQEVREWVLTDYLVALAKGDDLSTGERKVIIDKLHQYTGLPKRVIDQSNLRLSDDTMYSELLWEKKLRVGRLDSRITGRYRRDVKTLAWSDPSMDLITGPFAAAINEYLRQDLKYTNDIPYEVISSRVRPWNWGDGFQPVNTADILRGAMASNNSLNVRFICGYYDVATPFFDAEYTSKHMDLPPDLRKNISFAYYEAGHMMYIHKPSLIKLFKDTKEFYKKALE